MSRAARRRHPATEPDMKTGKPFGQAGFTYFGLLFAIATIALGMGAGAGMLSNDLRRDKELDLLFAGDAIRRAIEIYHAKNAAGQDPFPKQLEWLLRDPHQPSTQRYLRKIFRDPMHDPDQADSYRMANTWVLIYGPGERIIGVHSNSRDTPLKRAGFPQPYEGFSQARTYAEWRFIAAGAVAVAPQNNQTPKSFIPIPLAPAVPLVPTAPTVPTANPASGGSPARIGEGAISGVREFPPTEQVRPPASAVPEAPPPELPPVPVAVSPAIVTPPPAPVPAGGAAAGPAAPAPSPQAAPTQVTPPPSAPAEPPPFGAAPQPFIMQAPKSF